MATDWIERYGLRGDPFGETDAEGPFLLTPELNQRLNLLLHLVQYSELMLVVTGGRGSGKTTLLERLLADAGPRWRACVIEATAETDPDTLLARVLAGFDLADRGGERLAFIEDFLESQRRSATRPVLVVDDAHLLPPPALDQLARLAADRARLGLAVVAFGEPQLLERFGRGLGSTLMHVIDLPPLTPEQVDEYLALRLGWAGLKGRSPIGRDAVQVLAKTARGLPGLVNAAARQFLANRAEGGGARQALARFARLVPVPRLALAGAAVGLLTVVGVTLWLLTRAGGAPAPTVALVEPALPAAPEPALPRPRVEVVRPGSPPAPLPVAPPASVPPPTAAKAEPAPPPTPEPARPAAAPPGPEPGAKKAEPPAIEPAPAKAPPVRGDERWLLAQPPGHHTVQLFGSHDEKAAARFRDAQTLKDRVALYRTRRDGKDWYVVVVGSFATREAAQRAIQGLPAPLKRNNPWPRTLESVQTSIREAGTP